MSTIPYIVTESHKLSIIETHDDDFYQFITGD